MEKAMTKTDIPGTTILEATSKLIGGNLSLDFANSLDSWGSDYLNLVEWSVRAGIVDEKAASWLIKTAEARPAEADQTLEQALKLRQLIYSLFSAIAAGKPVAVGDLALLNSALGRVMEKLELVALPVGFKWDWKKGKDEMTLDRMLWSVIRVAADLMTSKELDRVKECPGQDCDRLFVDLSRNRSRRWCDMDHCGMLVKSRKHYAKIRQIKAVL
jgi:predicted RNA-binding Zn ribbon-like protein